MDFDTYQQLAQKTAIYPDKGNNLTYPTLGLNGEAGEVAEKVKKIFRDQEGLVDDDSREALAKELGDVLWYVAAMCSEIGVSMDDVARHNIAKLDDRQNRNAIHGSGDER